MESANPGTGYDYIVIGAGSAGCVLANRLSANPAHRVCLIEAGGRNTALPIKIPSGILAIYSNPKYDHMHMGAPQKELNGRQIMVNRGRGLGGSSAINSMLYIRGAAQDYDEWADLGCAGWGWQDVLPVFKDLERNRAGQDPAYHGTEGELLVEEQQDPNPVSRMFVAAGRNHGLPENRDFNGKAQLGLGIYQVTQNRAQRFSAYSAFVKPIEARPNLTVLTETSVRRLVLVNGRVTGVAVEGPQGAEVLACHGEVVLSAGAIVSPQLLLASGIGPAGELAAAGITPVVDLPGVGKNLADHVDGMVSARSRNPLTLGVSMGNLQRVIPAPLLYAMRRKGMLTTNYVEAGGFARTKYAGDLPDIQFHFVPGFRSLKGKVFEFGHGFALHTCVLRPKSLGQITLKPGSDGREMVIDHNFLAAEDDRLRLVDGIKVARSLLEDEAMKAVYGAEVVPGAEVQSDDEILGYLRAYCGTVFHPVGTCKMGNDPMAVADPASLRVRGVANLRVADASVMPTLIGGNTNAPSMMIGERAARMILTGAA